MLKLGGATNVNITVLGFMGAFTKIMKLEDIYIAGKVTDTIVTLPTSRHALSTFLDGRSIAVLRNFLVSKTLFILASNQVIEPW